MYTSFSRTNSMYRKNPDFFYINPNNVYKKLEMYTYVCMNLY